tara:strand:+ start:125 stop:367 length:243 start_codon:yes stop_codon:yes gene_type:complete
MGKKRIKLRVGDLLVKYDNGIPEQAILHKKQSPYYSEEYERDVPAMWEVIGWGYQYHKVLDSFLKHQIERELIEYYPAKK